MVVQILPFATAAIKSIKTVGSIVPSSDFLATKMVQPFRDTRNFKILELGAGTGVITKKILQRSCETCLIDSIELDKELVEFIQCQTWSQDYRLTIHNLSAFEFRKQLGYPDNSLDAIISSLPLSILPKAPVHRLLLDCRNQLKASGKFIQYQYSPYSLALLKRIFSRVQIGFETRNFPPALIYTCHK